MLQAQAPTRVRNYTAGRQVAPMAMNAIQAAACAQNLGALTNIGLDIHPTALRRMTALHNETMQQDALNLGMFGMDAEAGALSPQPNVTTSGVVTPVQFLQEFLPGAVHILTQVRTADEFIGMANMGSWHQAMIVQQLLELQGKASLYTDLSNMPMADWNSNFESRGIVRFQMGLAVGRLEQEVASEIRVDSAGVKRGSIMQELEIVRNKVAFYGWNVDTGGVSGSVVPTYGILNDPGLLPAIAAPTPAGGGQGFKDMTFGEIKNVIMTAVNDLLVQSGGRVQSSKIPLTMGLALQSYTYLSQVTEFGVSVYDWMAKSLGNVRVIPIPEFDDLATPANNLMYMMAESVADSGSDDNQVWLQCVPTKLFTLGVQQKIKGFEEGYSNATAGALLKRPYAVHVTSNV